VQTTALRSAANGIMITDRSGRIVWVNPATCRITGYSREELLGQHTRILKSGEHDDEFYRDLWETVTGGETWSGTIVNRRKDGTHYHEEQTIAPVSGDEGQISHFVAIKQDVTEQRRTQEALEQAHAELAARMSEIETLNLRLRDQALRDPLTGLHNRRYLEEVAPQEVARVVRAGRSLAVVALDVDHFKKVNDTHGHAAGDELLLRLADVLRQSLRSSDLVCRVGGEEFLVVLPGAPARAVKSRAERWRTAFAAAEVTSPAGAPVRSTVSIGAALLRPDEKSLEAAWRRADHALYEAKRQGRDRLVCDADLE
jgi:diguanylate cyclase (GGDEF)-like protein/PAS domain S-box-containing protein